MVPVLNRLRVLKVIIDPQIEILNRLKVELSTILPKLLTNCLSFFTLRQVNTSVQMTASSIARGRNAMNSFNCIPQFSPFVYFPFVDTFVWMSARGPWAVHVGTLFRIDCYRTHWLQSFYRTLTDLCAATVEVWSCTIITLFLNILYRTINSWPNFDVYRRLLNCLLEALVLSRKGLFYRRRSLISGTRYWKLLTTYWGFD